MADTPIGTPDQLRDPDDTSALYKAVPLGIQHGLAMFVSKVTPSIIVAGVVGFGANSHRSRNRSLQALLRTVTPPPSVSITLFSSFTHA